MIRSLWVLAILGLVGSVSAAQDKTEKKPAQEAFLGVGVEPVSPALRSHLTNLPEGQGIAVEYVAKDSPAAKAGLQRHDILLSFGDQKLSSPEQLVKMVRADKPDQTVTVGYFRAGKSATCQVTLAQKPQEPEGGRPNVYRFLPEENFFEEFEAKSGESGWTSFEAMNLKRTGEHQWSAEIEYRNKNGMKETKKFDGSRDDIRKAIQADKDLPANEQRHLLRALDMQRSVFEFHFHNGEATPGNRQDP